MPLLRALFKGGPISRFSVWLTHKILPKQGKWGRNSEPVACPACDTPQPKLRKPANRRQMMWGGWTCANCGVECDKWGERID